jgi:D-lactate dehydrogenase
MKVAFFSARKYEAPFFNESAGDAVRFTYLETRLSKDTVGLAAGHDAVCVFVNDEVDAAVLRHLHQLGIKAVALRCAGFNNVDIKTANSLGIKVVRVPAYSPYSVAEHTIALILTLNRKTHKAYNRVREGNFTLDGLMGFDLHGKTVGLIGTGKIGECTARILVGFGCRVLAYDLVPNAECEAIGVSYVSLDELYKQCDIISLHCPLTPDTYHMIGQDSISKMKQGVMIVNTSRGGLIDTKAVIQGLKSGKIGYLAIDVYEEESDLFFDDLSDKVIADDVFIRLSTFHNVLITGHQAFFTVNAMQNIADTTVANIKELAAGCALSNEVTS